MFVTKKALSRRTFLRGAGVAFGLPLLDAMVPAMSVTARTAAAPVTRMGFFYVANGMYPGSFHPKGEGKGFEFTPILKPLEPYRDYVTPITGLSNVQATIGSAGPHTRAHATFLNGVAPKATEGADIHSGKTVDQYAADVLGKDTALRSLEMALEPSSSGICDNGYSCVYVNTFSWRSATTPLPMENNPRQVFERLFGDSAGGDARARQLRTERSILDWVSEDLAELGQRLGAGDRATVDEYVTMVREVEGRIQKAERSSTNAFDRSAEPQPIGIPDSFDEHAKMMLDLQLLAYRADVTRVVSLQFSREQSARTYPWIGVNETHHGVSHHANEPGKILMNTKINAYHMSLFAHLVEKMRATPDGDGSLLDHSMLLYGSGFGDGNIHWARNLNVVVVGGGCGTLHGGRHLVVPADTPLMNVGVSLLDKAGAHVERVGDSTGPLVDL